VSKRRKKRGEGRKKDGKKGRMLKVWANCQKQGGIFYAFVIGAYWIFPGTLV
jgi:hypothetical protein